MPQKSSVPALRKGSQLEKIYRWLAKKCAVTGTCLFGPEMARAMAKKFNITHEPNIWRVLRYLEAKRVILRRKALDKGFYITDVYWEADPATRLGALHKDFRQLLTEIETRISIDQRTRLVEMLDKLESMTIAFPSSKKPRH